MSKKRWPHRMGQWPPMQRFRPIGGRSVCELCVFIVTCSSNRLLLQVGGSQPTEVSYVTGDHKIAQVYSRETWCSRCCPFRKWSTTRLRRVCNVRKGLWLSSYLIQAALTIHRQTERQREQCGPPRTCWRSQLTLLRRFWHIEQLHWAIENLLLSPSLDEGFAPTYLPSLRV